MWGFNLEEFPEKLDFGWRLILEGSLGYLVVEDCYLEEFLKSMDRTRIGWPTYLKLHQQLHPMPFSEMHYFLKLIIEDSLVKWTCSKEVDKYFSDGHHIPQWYWSWCHIQVVANVWSLYVRGMYKKLVPSYLLSWPLASFGHTCVEFINPWS